MINMQSPVSQRSYYHVSDDSNSVRRDAETYRMQRARCNFDAIRQALPPTDENTTLRIRSKIVLIRALLTRAYLRIIYGDLDGAEWFVQEAYRCLERLQDKWIGSKIDHMQQLIEQYRKGEHGRPRRNSSPCKRQHHRPPPIHIHRQRRGSDGDNPSTLATTNDSLFKSLMNNIQDEMPQPSGRSSTTRSGRAVTDEDARAFFQRAASQKAPSSGSSSSGDVSRLFNRLAYGDLPRNRPAAQVAERAAPRPLSGGIDGFHRRNYKNLPYSPNIKDCQTLHPDLSDNSTSRWNDALPTPSGFIDPFKGLSPPSNGTFYRTKLDHIQERTELQAPRATSPHGPGITSPIYRPSHPAPHISIPASAFPLARRRSSTSSPTDTSSNPARRTSAEDISPEGTDGPALPKLLTLMQPNPHLEHSLTSPTERVRRLSIEETRIAPTRRLSLTIPFNASSSDKTAASTPSPLRQSFLASEINFEPRNNNNNNNRHPHYPNEKKPTANKLSPTTAAPVPLPLSRQSPKKISPQTSPKTSPRTSRIPTPKSPSSRP